MTGFDNPDMFFVPDTPLTKIYGELKALPLDIQNEFAGIISGHLKQFQQFYNLNQQGYSQYGIQTDNTATLNAT